MSVQQALGRYELLRPLAKGGMAEVYLARRRVAGVEKRLVIKRMRREHSRDPRFLDLFVREAQLSMSLVQPNIVPVFDFGRIGDDVFLAMEHIDGKDLGSTLARDRSAGLPPMLAAFVAAECCAALEHAHQHRDAATPQGVIHRDVTPRNVLVTWSGDVLLADFGIAAVVGQAAGDSMGTPGYMAPEQALGGVVDARADVYALGIVLWESMTGVHVRPHANRAEAVAAAKSGELPPIPDAVPPALAEVIRRATQVAPDDRFDGARAMGDALDAFIVEERARAVGPSPGRRLGEWLKARWAGATEAEGESAAGVGVGVGVAEMVTFLDDGAEEVRGSRTERSVAETAASVPPAVAAEVIPIAAPVKAEIEVPATASHGTWRPGRGAWVGAVTAGVIAVGAAWWWMKAPATPTQAATEPAVVATPAPAPDAAAATLPPTPTITVPPPPSPIAATANPGKKIPKKTPTVSPKTNPPGMRPAVVRPMMLGAVPWANITVDGQPTVYETPVTIPLTVGIHRVTYTNPQLGITRTVTVTVPSEGAARHVETLR